MGQVGRVDLLLKDSAEIQGRREPEGHRMEMKTMQGVVDEKTILNPRPAAKVGKINSFIDDVTKKGTIDGSNDSTVCGWFGALNNSVEGIGRDTLAHETSIVVLAIRLSQIVLGSNNALKEVNVKLM